MADPTSSVPVEAGLRRLNSTFASSPVSSCGLLSATWYSTVTPHGPAGRPPWQSLLWLSNIVGLSLFSWVAGLNISLGVTAQPIFGPASVQRVLNLLPRVFDAAFDRLLRSAPVTDVYDGPTGTSPAGPSALL